MPRTAIVPLDRERLALVAPSWDGMKNAIEKCSRVDEIKDLADKAVAVQAYYRQSQDVDNEIQASRIRVRAERRMGELLEAMQKRGDREGHGGDRKSNERDARLKISDLGIPPDRATRAQQLARVPEKQFEAALGESRVVHPRAMLDGINERTPIKKTLGLWGSVRDLGAAIESGEMPDLKFWRDNIQPFQVEHLRRYIPVIIKYLSALQKEL